MRPQALGQPVNNLEEKGRVLTNKMNHLLRHLAGLKGRQKILGDLKTVLTEIDAVRGQRNLVIHGDWLGRDINDHASSVTVIRIHQATFGSKDPGMGMHRASQRHEAETDLSLAGTKGTLDTLRTLENTIRTTELRGAE